MVEVFKGSEIEESKIEKLKSIARKRYEPSIYEEYFSNIESEIGYTSIGVETLYLGTDWFLRCLEADEYIEIFEWVSTDTEVKPQQVAEMIGVFKRMFIKNERKFFIASMRHDTSYSIYLRLLKRGYLNELKHEYMLDVAADKDDAKVQFLEGLEGEDIEAFLSSNASIDYAEYFKYILHNLCFEVTDAFFKRYGPSEDAKSHVLKMKDYTKKPE